jgi:hypothetical protein
MKPALLVLALLGTLAWCAKVALLFVLSQPQPTAAPATVAGYLDWIVPAFGLLVGILGAVSARRRHAARWATRFTIFAVLVVALLVVGFGVVVVVFVLTFENPNPALEALATGGADLGFLFPIVVFVAALLYVLRGEAPAGTATGQP